MLVFNPYLSDRSSGTLFLNDIKIILIRKAVPGNPSTIYIKRGSYESNGSFGQKLPDF